MLDNIVQSIQASPSSTPFLHLDSFSFLNSLCHEDILNEDFTFSLGRHLDVLPLSLVILLLNLGDGRPRNQVLD
jgi:hypothetical protein